MENNPNKESYLNQFNEYFEEKKETGEKDKEKKFDKVEAQKEKNQLIIMGLWGTLAQIIRCILILYSWCAGILLILMIVISVLNTFYPDNIHKIDNLTNVLVTVLLPSLLSLITAIIFSPKQK
jgi:hypothetical protein